MDAIARLGMEAGSLHHREKRAFLGKALSFGSKMLPKLNKAIRVGGNVANPVSMRRLGTAAAGTGLAGAAGVDTLQGAVGGWSGRHNPNNLDWHRQRMQGGTAGGWLSPSAWMATLANPVQSLAATAGGYGNRPGVAMNRPLEAPAATWNEQTQTYDVRPSPVEYSPYMQQQIESHSGSLEQEAALRRQLQEMNENLQSGNFGGGWFSGSVSAQRQAYLEQMEQLKQQLRQQAEMRAAMEPQLQAAGYRFGGGQSAPAGRPSGQPSGPMTAPGQPSSPDNDELVRLLAERRRLGLSTY